MELTNKDLNKTVYVKKDYTDNNRKWYKVDASGKTLGRLAVEIAKYIIGKNKAHYNDFWDIGDFVVVENVSKIVVTGNKLEDKIYYKHTGYKGHLRTINLGKLNEKDPTKALWFAVRGMLPKNKLRAPRMKRLKLFAEAGNKYDHLSPETLNIND